MILANKFYVDCLIGYEITLIMLERKPPKIEFVIKHSLKEESSKKFNCTQFDSSYSHKRHLIEHFDTKHKGIRHSCTKCSLHFSRKSFLNKHIQAFHKTTCHICYFESYDEVSNKSHIDSCHAVLICTEC